MHRNQRSLRNATGCRFGRRERRVQSPLAHPSWLRTSQPTTVKDPELAPPALVLVRSEYDRATGVGIIFVAYFLQGDSVQFLRHRHERITNTPVLRFSRPTSAIFS